MYDLAIVLALALLAGYAFKFLQEKARAVPRNYDVFLSFRGRDTRTGFTDFLYNSLVVAGVHVFRDDDALPVGEEVGQELLRAIRSCKIAIPIISEQYAQSKWCLRELAEIMKCHHNGTSVFPVFYKVNDAHVRCQKGNFREALDEHERQLGYEEVRGWRDALSSVGRIKGWTSETIANGHEGELVKMVVAKVSSELKTTWMERLPLFPVPMTKYPIRSVYSHYYERKRRKDKCDVFIAFRGSDTRFGLAAYLYISLVAAGIRVFNGDDQSLIGEDFAHEIGEAIDQSKIAIPIISENFATSRWCLDELAQMIDCKRTKGQKILPVFYKVEPSQVRCVSDSFGEKMLQHKDVVDRSTYERWELALKEVGSFKAWVSENIANGHEGVLVKQIVKEVSSLLKNNQKRDSPSPSTEF